MNACEYLKNKENLDLFFMYLKDPDLSFFFLNDDSLIIHKRKNYGVQYHEGLRFTVVEAEILLKSMTFFVYSNLLPVR